MLEYPRLEKTFGKWRQVACRCKCLRRNSCGWDFYHTTTTYMPSILHLTLTRRNTLAINALHCVRYCWYYLHTTYTQPTHNLHNLHTPQTATRYKHGRTKSRHRGAEKFVAPTDFPTSLWRISHRIRPNRLRGSRVGCVRCLQGCVWYFEIILHSWNIWISSCYARKV